MFVFKGGTATVAQVVVVGIGVAFVIAAEVAKVVIILVNVLGVVALKVAAAVGGVPVCVFII